MATKAEFKEKAKEFSEAIQNAFTAYANYQETLRYDRYENKQGQNRNVTRLYNKFYNICLTENVCIMRASAILGNARD